MRSGLEAAGHLIQTGVIYPDTITYRSDSTRHAASWQLRLVVERMENNVRLVLSRQ